MCYRARFTIPIILLVVGVPTVSARAADWLQFRGPTGDGRAEASNLPARWGGFDSPTWQADIPGQGWSSPIVIGDRIWLTAAEPTALTDAEREARLAQSFDAADRVQFQAHASVTCYAIEVAAASGEVLRTIELFTCADPPLIHTTNTYASPTPASDGQRLVCHFGSLGTACLEVESGKVQWQVRQKFDEVTGPGSSPVIHEDRVILPCDGADQQYVVALDLRTGAALWKTARPPIKDADSRRRRAFSTPLVIEHAGRSEAVVPAAEWVVAYDPASGAELWRVHVGAGQHATVPRPVSRAGLVYVCTGFLKPQLWAIRTGGSGDVTESHVAWKYDKQVPEVASPVVVENEIYFVSSIGVATCLDARTGDVVWQHRLGGNYAASPLAADGKLYFTSMEGITTVLRPGREYSELAKNRLFGQTLASPAVCGDALLIRAGRKLYCVGNPVPGTSRLMP
jgi:outer membrane protein assembly factor BamB